MMTDAFVADNGVVQRGQGASRQILLWASRASHSVRIIAGGSRVGSVLRQRCQAAKDVSPFVQLLTGYLKLDH